MVNHLIWNAEKNEDEMSPVGCARSKALAMLCAMSPGQALAVRAKCVEACRLPTLAVSLTLDHAAADTSTSHSDVV